MVIIVTIFYIVISNGQNFSLFLFCFINIINWNCFFSGLRRLFPFRPFFRNTWPTIDLWPELSLCSFEREEMFFGTRLFFFWLRLASYAICFHIRILVVHFLYRWIFFCLVLLRLIDVYFCFRFFFFVVSLLVLSILQ